MIQKFFHIVISTYLDAIAPRHCLGTGNPLSSSDRFATSLLSDDYIQSLEYALSSERIIHHCNDILGEANVVLKEIHAMYFFEPEEPIQNIIYLFKYNHYKRIGTAFGILLGEYLLSQYKRFPEVIIPIPLHPVRQRERGFNQSEIIATEVGRILKRPVLKTTVERKIYRDQQVHQKFSDRINYDEKMFFVRKKENIFGKHVLLIDDVLTTGSTVNAVAKSLRTAGARRVDTAVICLTKAKKNNNAS